MKRFCVILSVAVAVLSAVPSFACTTAIISAKVSGTGRPLLWKQRDAKYNYNHMMHLQGERYSFTALVPTTGKIPKAAMAGANEKGFAIVNNNSSNINPEGVDTPNRNGIILMQALGTCATVDEFEQFLKDMEQPRGAKGNFAVIDAYGGAAYFETGNEVYFRYDVEDSPSGYLFRTNFSFGGTKGKGGGYIRYDAAETILRKKGSGFTPGWILDNLARSFYHGLMGTDLKNMKDKQLGSGIVACMDYIPNNLTVSSVVIEGINPGENPAEVIIWSAMGYAPAAYAIPVWVGAGDEIPACISAELGSKAKAPANRLAVQLKYMLFPTKKENRKKYLDYRTLRKEITPVVAASEKKEIAQGEKLKKQFAAGGFDIEAVKAYNKGADRRFNVFRRKMKTLMEARRR